MITTLRKLARYIPATVRRPLSVSIEEIWGRYRFIRQELKRGVRKLEMCKSCKARQEAS